MLAGRDTQCVKTLKSLIALDFAAIIAYRAAIKRLEDEVYRRAFTRFLSDHLRHTRELATLLQQLGGSVPIQLDARTILTKGKLLAGHSAGDLEILSVMHASEGDTNTVYEHACLELSAPEVHAIVRRGLNDERRHKAWLECILGQDRPASHPSLESTALL